MPRRYPLLRVIAEFYKLMALLSFMATTGAVFYSASETFRNTPVDANPVQTAVDSITRAMPVLAAGIVLMVTFYAFAQIIDLLITLNLSVRVMMENQHNEKRKSPELTP